MNVLLFTEGGADIGIGHITRCLSLYQAFEEKGITPLFIINGDETVRDLVRGINCEIFNWIKEERKLFNLLKDTDVAIVDSYKADPKFYEIISKSVNIPVYIDDTKRIDYPRGIVINGTIYAEDLDYPKRKDVTYLLGSKYIPIRKEFCDVPEKEIKENIEKVMITFGGDDAKNMTPKVLKLLNKNFPELKKKVIIGKGFKNIEQIEILKHAKTELVYYPDAEGMKQIMLESDIAISAGGQTLYEFARVGIPSIAIAVADNQMNNIKGWQKAGFIEYVGWWKDNGLTRKVLDCFEGLKNREIRMEKSLTGQRFVDGRGSRRIVDLLLGHKA